jgi:hypothetical protein
MKQQKSILPFAGRALNRSRLFQAFGLALLPVLAAADLLVQEGFDYLPGALAGSNGGTGWSGPWRVPPGLDSRDMECREGSLDYGPLETSGNRAYVDQKDSGTTGFSGLDPMRHDNVERPATPLALGGGKTVLWFSLLVRIDAASFSEGWFGVKTTAQNNYWFGLNANQKTYGMELPSVNSTIPFTTHRADLMVMKLQVRPDGKLDKFLWVNPPHDTLGGADLDPQTAAVTSLAATPVQAIDRFLFSCSNEGDLDEFRAGDTYADVTPVKSKPATESVAPVGTPRWVNGVPAGELESVEPGGLTIRSTRGTRTLVPWSSLSPATRYRLQPGFQDRLPGLLKGRTDANMPAPPSTP